MTKAVLQNSAGSLKASQKLDSAVIELLKSTVSDASTSQQSFLDWGLIQFKSHESVKKALALDDTISLHKSL